MIPIAAASLRPGMPVTPGIRPTSRASIIVKKIPNCAAAPKNNISGSCRSGPKSIIAPTPLKMRMGKSSFVIPPLNKTSRKPPPTADENGMLASRQPNPIGNRRFGSYSFFTASQISARPTPNIAHTRQSDIPTIPRSKSVIRYPTFFRNVLPAVIVPDQASSPKMRNTPREPMPPRSVPTEQATTSQASLSRRSPVLTVWLDSTATSSTVQSRGARISFSIFMASIMSRVSPFFQELPGVAMTFRILPGSGDFMAVAPPAGATGIGAVGLAAGAGADTALGAGAGATTATGAGAAGADTGEGMDFFAPTSSTSTSNVLPFTVILYFFTVSPLVSASAAWLIVHTVVVSMPRLQEAMAVLTAGTTLRQ